MPQNRLYYGDNLAILRDKIGSESVDLIYLDPPFNSNANYNVLFAEKDGTGSAHAACQRLRAISPATSRSGVAKRAPAGFRGRRWNSDSPGNLTFHHQRFPLR